jgi:hypothetical protein
VAVAALAVAHTVDLWLLDGEVRWLEAGSGRSIFEWLATASLGLSALAVALLAYRRRERRTTRIPLAVGLLLVFLADALSLTGRVGAAGDALIVLGLGVVFVLLWRESRTLVPDGGLVRLGLLLLALSVATRVGDPVVSALDWEHGEFPYEAKVVVKHGAELAGWILVAFGVVPPALSRRSRVRSRGAAVRAADSG